MEKAPTSPGVGASIKGGEQENELERTLPLYYTTKLYFVLTENVSKKTII